MEKIEEFKEKANDIIYPVFYNNGVLFKDSATDIFYLYKENLIRTLDLEDIVKDVYYPNSNEELIEIESVINYIFMRLSNSQFLKNEDKQLFKIIKDIKINSTINVINLNSLSQAAQVLANSKSLKKAEELI